MQIYVWQNVLNVWLNIHITFHWINDDYLTSISVTVILRICVLLQVYTFIPVDNVQFKSEGK